MRKTLGLLFVLILALGVAGQAGAKTMQWHGTLVLDLGALASAYYHGSGVATVNSSSGGAHLSTLRLAGGITGSDVIPVTDPNTTPQVKSIIITETMKTGTFTNISGAPPVGNGVLPLAGYTRVCLFVPGCAANINMNNTANGTVGVGIAGFMTLGGNGSVRISVGGAPWTLGTVTGVNQTVKGNWITLSRKGFAHGGASATDSSTAITSGVIQFIGPSSVKTVGIVGNSQDISLFLEMNLHFIPEPGLLLLLGSGIVGLALVGRSRPRK